MIFAGEQLETARRSRTCLGCGGSFHPRPTVGRPSPACEEFKAAFLAYFSRPRTTQHDLEATGGARFAAVQAVAQRARQLAHGAPPTIDRRSPNDVAAALAELEAGTIRVRRR